MSDNSQVLTLSSFDDSKMNDIFAQLMADNTYDQSNDQKNNTTDNDPVTTENVEEFILKQSSKLIENSASAVEMMKEYVSTAPNADDVSALAELIGATSTALETLNKLNIANKRNKTAKEIKEMDINSKQQQLTTAIQGKLLLTREELMKELKTASEKIIEAEVIKTTIS